MYEPVRVSAEVYTYIQEMIERYGHESRYITANIKGQQDEQRTQCHEGELRCSRRHAKSFSNNRSQILLLHVVLHVASRHVVVPADSSMALLQTMAEPLLRRIDQPEY